MLLRTQTGFIIDGQRVERPIKANSPESFLIARAVADGTLPEAPTVYEAAETHRRQRAGTAARIRELLKTDMPAGEIARKLDVPVNEVSRVNRRAGCIRPSPGRGRPLD